MDDDAGLDVKFPRASQAMSHISRPEEKVDFSDVMLKRQAMVHLDKCSENDMGQRPFLSASTDLGDLRAYHKSCGRDVKAEFVRIDMFALWLDGKLDEHSFADLSSKSAFANFVSQISRLRIYARARY